MASPENTDANSLFVWLLGVVDLYVEETDLGEVYGSRVACRLDDENAPESDILFIRKDQLHRVKRGRIDGPADVVFEIVSPESIQRDYEDKRKLYEKHRVREYWIIDEEARKVTVHRLNARGKYALVRPRHGELHSLALPGFWLRPDWLWQNPRAKKLATMRQILERRQS
jgi:Uma2 family endonuclease